MELGSELEPVPATQKAEGLDEGVEVCVEIALISKKEDTVLDGKLESSLIDKDSLDTDDVSKVPIPVVTLEEDTPVL